MLDFDWKECIDCGDDVPASRYQAFCLFCERDREHSAEVERSSWCIVQEYTKGNYQYVTNYLKSCALIYDFEQFTRPSSDEIH